MGRHQIRFIAPDLTFLSLVGDVSPTDARILSELAGTRARRVDSRLIVDVRALARLGTGREPRGLYDRAHGSWLIDLVYQVKVAFVGNLDLVGFGLHCQYFASLDDAAAWACIDPVELI